MDALVARLRGASAEMTPPVVGASKSSVPVQHQKILISNGTETDLTIFAVTVTSLVAMASRFA